ncbi:hypothetical protein [Sulfurimonas sp.]|uniref:hypothetical protein n=1 Tax=Sulfurimonas sp. TaxID=2022749 RepID=UPI002B48CE04|nr:hypothetical protein [Sulfurimonas sp.]
MYESLKKYSDKFHLYIFAFDDKSYELLKRLDLEFVTIISLKEFEDEVLLKLKSSRSTGEYCWTCTPSTIKYCIETYSLSSCTYLDADLYFFSNPSVLIDEMKDKSVLITEHRYTPMYEQSATSGIYCVQFMTFKNDKNGMKVLNWWIDACNDWCYARNEDGKFGDQKYLDDWTNRFEGVHVLKNLGGGVAPWNIQQYDLSDNKFKLIFYHFHNYKILEDDKIEFGTYKLNNNDIKILYIPYTKHLKKITKELKLIDKINDYNGIVEKKPFHWKDSLRVLKRKTKGTYNVFTRKELLGQ